MDVLALSTKETIKKDLFVRFWPLKTWRRPLLADKHVEGCQSVLSDRGSTPRISTRMRNRYIKKYSVFLFRGKKDQSRLNDKFKFLLQLNSIVW